MCREGFLGKCVQPFGAGIPFNRLVKAVGFESYVPGPETCQFLRRQLLDGSFDFFGGSHSSSIASRAAVDKCAA
jgi:hypothetical protein